jgi:hypothetical protein
LKQEWQKSPALEPGEQTAKNLVWVWRNRKKIYQIINANLYILFFLLIILCIEGVLEAAGHTNTMMWIGRMEDCPIDLSSQVSLLNNRAYQGSSEKS